MLVLIVSKSMNNFVGSFVKKTKDGKNCHFILCQHGLNHLINPCFKTALRHSAVYKDDEKPMLNR